MREQERSADETTWWKRLSLKWKKMGGKRAMKARLMMMIRKTLCDESLVGKRKRQSLFPCPTCLWSNGLLPSLLENFGIAIWATNTGNCGLCSSDFRCEVLDQSREARPLFGFWFVLVGRVELGTVTVKYYQKMGLTWPSKPISRILLVLQYWVGLHGPI